MAKLKKLLTVQVGRARPTDEVLDLKVSKTLLRDLKELAADGVVTIERDDMLVAMGNFGRPQIDVAEISGDGSGQIAPEILNFEKKSALDTAKEIIYGDREEAYGSPRFNLDSIAQFWNVYLNRKHPDMPDHQMTAEDVAQFMILLKMARLIHNPTHFDSITDQIGYAALQDRIQGM